MATNQINFSTYKKRKGTSDLGKEYEWMMCALYAVQLSTSDRVVDFEMTTNRDIYADFDDIELKVTYDDGKLHTFLLQLKHSENRRNITDNILTAEKGDFSLSKYLDSFQKLQNKEKVSCVLLTNNTTSLRDGSTFFFDNHEIRVKQVATFSEDFLNTGSVFQFRCEESSHLTKVDAFFEHFYLLVCQDNVAKCKLTLSQMLKELLRCEIYDNYVHFMREWWSGNFVLTKQDVISKLAELALSPFAAAISGDKCNNKSELIVKTIMTFEMTLVEDFDEDIISKIWRSNCNIHEVSLTALKYGLVTKKIKDVNELSPTQKAKVLWHLNKAPLVVKMNDLNKIRITSVTKLLEKCKKRKKLLLVLEIDNTSKEEFPNWKIFKNLSDIRDKKNFDDIIERFEISLQGRQSISLKQFINFDPEFSTVIKTRELFKMTHNILSIGNKEENLPESYIPRTVTSVFLDNSKLLTLYSKIENLFIINCEGKFNNFIDLSHPQTLELEDYLEQIKLDNITRQLLRKTMILSKRSKCTKAQFDFICNKLDKQNVFLIQVVDENCCLLLLSKKGVAALSEVTIENPPIKEEDIYKYFDNELSVISASPGMGKSTLMTFLSNNCPSEFWFVRINLISENSFFKTKTGTAEMLCHFMKMEETNQNSFLLQVKSYFLGKKRVYLFLDGLDEIDSDCLNYFLNQVNKILSMGFHVWISSRQNLQAKLLDEFNTVPITINELDREQQKMYIQLRLQQKYEEKDIEEITNKIFESVNVSNGQMLLGVPLQLYLITENFLNNRQLTHSLDDSIFLLTKMYKIFLSGKMKHLHQKLGIDEYEQQLGIDLDFYLEQYELAALKTCLDSKVLEKLHADRSKIDKFLVKIKGGDPFGIISQIEDDQIVFIHHSFAEYLTSVWLKKHPEKLSLLQDELFTEKCQNLRLIFDMLVAESCPLHLAAIFKNTDEVQKNIKDIEKRDDGGRTALHLICSYGTKYPSLTRHENGSYFRNFVESEDPEYEKILTILLQDNVYNVEDTLFRWTCIDYASRSRCLFPIEKILKKYSKDVNLNVLLEYCADVSVTYYTVMLNFCNLFWTIVQRNSSLVWNSFIDEWGENHDLLQLAVTKKNTNDSANDSLTIIKILIGEGLSLNNEEGETIFHVACKAGNHDLIETLVKLGAEIYPESEKTSNLFYRLAAEGKLTVEMTKLLVNYNVNVDKVDANGVNSLHILSQGGDFENLEFLIRFGVDVNILNNQNRNALHYAVLTPSNANVINLLVASGVDINGKDINGATPLHLATKIKNCENIELLIKRGANVVAVNHRGRSALHFAVTVPSNADVITLLGGEGVDIDCRDATGFTPLHLAYKREMFDNVRALVTLGANVDAVDDKQRSLLHRAALSSSAKATEFLIDEGTNVNARDISGITPLHLAYGQGNVDVVKILVDRGASIKSVTDENRNVLHYAVTSDQWNKDEIKNLLEIGVEVNLQDAEGITPLHLAALHLGRENVKLLIEYGADVNVKCNKKRSALHYAATAEYSNREVIDLLTSRGIDVNAQDISGESALHLASDVGHCGNLKDLLSAGANPHALTHRRRTIIHYAAALVIPTEEVLNLLLDTGVDVNIQDVNGITSLHLASAERNYTVVKMLIENGVDVNTVTSDQRTSLHYAASTEYANARSARLLLNAGINVNARDAEGMTALHLASRVRNYEIVEMLVDNGADVTILCNMMKTSLHYAAMSKFWNKEVIHFLMSKGVKVTAKDLDGLSASDYASQSGHETNQEEIQEQKNIELRRKRKRFKPSCKIN
jgi:ankyrin repeat protein